MSGAPFLSFAETLTTTNWLLASNLKLFVLPDCCAQATDCAMSKMAMSARMLQNLNLRLDGDFAHGGRGGRQAVVAGAQHGAPVGDGDVVEHVLRLELQIDAAPFAEAEDTAHGLPLSEKMVGPGDGVPSRIAPLPGSGRGEGRGIEEHPGRFHRQARGIGAQRIAHRGSAHLREVAAHDRGERVPRMDG